MTKRSLEIYIELWKFRKELERKYKWRTYPHVFYNACSIVSELSLHYLYNRGIEEGTLGFVSTYIPPSPQFTKVHTEQNCLLEKKYNHDLICDCEERVYYDLTRDQFYPYDEENYRVVRESFEQVCRPVKVDSVRVRHLMREDNLWDCLNHDLLRLNLRNHLQYLQIQLIQN